MPRKSGLFLVTVAGLLVGCAPAIDPAAKADIDARVRKLRSQSIAVLAPASDAIESMPLAVGQWAEYEITAENGEPKFLTQKIVGQEADALLFEIVHDTYQGRTVEQMLVFVGDRKDPTKVELRAVRKKDAKGHVTTLSRTDLWVARNHLGPVNSYWEDALAVSLVTNWRGKPQTSTAVVAGHFEGCYHSQAQVTRSLPGWVLEAWAHPSVPFGGLVRKDDNRGFVSQLVAYGTGGAQSDL